jgi:hypothetical protein
VALINADDRAMHKAAQQLCKLLAGPDYDSTNSDETYLLKFANILAANALKTYQQGQPAIATLEFLLPNRSPRVTEAKLAFFLSKKISEPHNLKISSFYGLSYVTLIVIADNPNPEST